MSASIFHPLRLSLYAILSAADLGLTYVLIRQGHGEIYESNPIAEAWLSAYGWAGLAVFKSLIVLVVAGVVAFVSLSRPRTGGHILTFACFAVAAVVGYSVHLTFSQQVHARFLASPVASAEVSPQPLLGIMPGNNMVEHHTRPHK
ncbi:MAG TPA: DUF5658 family protein [Gemmataceae bacterium]|nr:DUF5658 family protein [Gemmataceae bacterium]